MWGQIDGALQDLDYVSIPKKRLPHQMRKPQSVEKPKIKRGAIAPQKGFG